MRISYIAIKFLPVSLYVTNASLIVNARFILLRNLNIGLVR